MHMHRRPFLAALLCSSAATLLWSAAAWLLRARMGVRGPGVSGLLMRLPGAKYVTATPHWQPGGGPGSKALPAPSSSARAAPNKALLASAV
jgi:hypothetical protein